MSQKNKNSAPQGGSKLEELMAALPVHEQEALLAQVEDYRKAKEREVAQNSFMAFVRKMWPGFIHGRHHAVVAKAFEDIASGKIKRLAISMPPRHAIMTGMKIPTLAGMKTMNDLLVGDFVFGPDGKPVEVLGKSEVFKNRKLYRVTTDDGASLVVDGEHLWTVRLDRKRGNWLDYKTEDLWLRQNGWMVRRMPNGSVQKIKLKDQKEVRLPMLPPVQPVEYEPRLLEIDPYVLGVWLGDGSRSSAVITCHDDDAVYMRAEFEKRGYTTTDQATRFTFGVLNLQVKLKDLGVHKNKHIPRKYLEASAFQRRELLKGLMDTDGNVSKAGQCFFAQSNRDFIEQVAELIRSLGIKANILESEAKIGEKSYGKTWKISFYASDVFTLPRKEDRTLKGERKFGRYIKVEALEESGDTQCIKVNRDDGLFLAGEGYICTHNTKSEFGSYMLPAWFLGKFPDKKVMQASNTGELAVGFGRKVRNLVMSEMYHEVFPSTNLRSDSKAAGRWAVNDVGEYFAIGVGGTMTGRGADLVIIDDPHTEGEATQAAHDPSIYDKAYEWYTSGPRQRLQPGGAIIIIACMTGETKVLMNNGSEKELRNIKVQDCVATYENGAITTAKVLNWKSQGFDDILKITTTSGKIVRANKRHPFLVEQNGVREWIKVKDLKVGQHLIGVVQQMDAQGQDMPKGYAEPATKTKHGQKENLGQHQKQQQEQLPSGKPTTQTQLVIGESGLGWSAQPMGAASQQKPKDFAILATPVRRGLKEKIATLQKRFVTTVLNQGTELIQAITKKCCSIKMAAVQFANSLQATATLGLIKKGNFALTIATAQERLGGSCATTATWQLDTQKQSQPCSVPQSTYEVTLDAIVSIELDGYEEVFDVEIDRTENFIANGLVSHNTRWGENDLIGRVLKDAADRGKPDEWRVIEFPAILPSGNPLWPEFWPLDQLEALKEELAPSKWNAQYQQQPTGEEGAIVKREWWNIWEREDPPRCEFIIQAWDTAFTKNERSDFSACTTWGIFHMNEDPNDINIILLDSFQKRMEFPELKEKARAHYIEWQPDDCIIEAKAAGASLIQELNQQSDMFVRGYTPSRGTRQQSNDKIARMNSVAPIFQSGKVWAPDTRWARELIDQMASFPNSAHDDLADTAVMAVTRFRQGGFLRLESDEREEVQGFRRKTAFY